jgi:hypothetical protein
LESKINVIQETKSRNKRKSPTENKKTNGEQEAHMRPPSLKIWRPASFQAFPGVEFP